MGQIFSSPAVPVKGMMINDELNYLREIMNLSMQVKRPTIITSSGNKRAKLAESEELENTEVEEEPTPTPDELLKSHAQLVSPPREGECSICMCSLNETSSYGEEDENENEIAELRQCSHSFHKACLVEMIGALSYLQCPVCKTIHGVRIGNQPPGIMEVSTISESLPGYPDCDTISIAYFFVNGVQGPEHPNPGEPYRAHAFPRKAFLPNNEEGKKVLELLKMAWKRRLVFTIGTSVTSGLRNVITWNEIHHKTSFSNAGGHGYPDPEYLANVTMELALQGVTEDSLKDTDLGEKKAL